MDNIDFAALPDAEAARLMAELDGFILSGPKCTWFNQRQYTTSLDAAVAWLGRMGLEWERREDREARGKYLVTVYAGSFPFDCKESPTCPTSRALCNAGWAAVAAREVNHG